MSGAKGEGRMTAEQWLAQRGLADLCLGYPKGKPIPGVDYPSKGQMETLPHLMQAYADAQSAGAQQDGKYPIDRPCSACSAGDREMKYHDHSPPFRKGYGPSAAGSAAPATKPLDALYEAELNQEQIVSAVMCGLQEMCDRGCQEVAALQWFREGYNAAIEKLKSADEAEVFAMRKDKPTLTGASVAAEAAKEDQ